MPIFHTNEVPPIAPQMLVFWGNKWVTFKLKFVIFVAFLRAKRAGTLWRDAGLNKFFDTTDRLLWYGNFMLYFGLSSSIHSFFDTFRCLAWTYPRSNSSPFKDFMELWHTLWNKDEQSQFFRYFPFSLFTNFILIWIISFTNFINCEQKFAILLLLATFMNIKLIRNQNHNFKSKSTPLF